MVGNIFYTVGICVGKQYIYGGDMWWVTYFILWGYALGKHTYIWWRYMVGNIMYTVGVCVGVLCVYVVDTYQYRHISSIAHISLLACGYPS